MCLAIPMQIKSVDGMNAVCSARGIERQISLLMVQHEQVAVGDRVMVQMGHAIRKVSEQEAEESWSLFDEILAATKAPSDGDR
ncbi:MAG: HypC/HybG/HupF family hydrogenase formation chaperone [Parvularcula sp.]